MRVELSGRIEFNAILHDCGLPDYKICDFIVGNDEMIHILLAETIPEREQGRFVPTVSNAHYQAVSMLVDWQDGEFVGYEKTDFGVLKPNLHYIQKLNDGFLLLGARASYNSGSPDRNALITDSLGKVIASHCFGDGIQQCLVDSQNRIITSYFDEGIFGNLGWDHPIGSGGIILWSAEGTCLWKNTNYEICDCYAMNLDQQDHLWFYYYPQFELVRTDYQRDQTYTPGITGASAFLIHPTGQQLILNAGYSKHKTYTHKKIQGPTIRRGHPLTFVHNGKTIHAHPSFRQSKALFLDKHRNLYFGDWW